ncbi:MAG: succinate--CoA ligase subunit alpha [Firmicutes bacterium]|nr:succinate--CoA ligase subunit alpha [Bacillota bacterium]
MSILINKKSKVLIQGITGSHGQFHAGQMIDYGTNVVGGVTPGKGGQTVLNGVPVFDTVLEAVKKTKANVSCIFVPPSVAADSIIEAAEAGIPLIVCITEGIPVHDMMRVKLFLEGKKTKLIGPNCPGLISPDEAKVGIMPASIHRKGKVGVVSRSGTLTYEAVNQLTLAGIGQSTAIGIGGDTIKGLGFVEVLKLFEKDPETLAVVMIGEIGGSGEEEAADYIKTKMTKPVAGFIGGATAPEGKRMGHAGAIIMGGKGTAEGKKRVLKEAGVIVAETPDLIGEALIEAVKKVNIFDKVKIR